MTIGKSQLLHSKVFEFLITNLGTCPLSQSPCVLQLLSKGHEKSTKEASCSFLNTTIRSGLFAHIFLSLTREKSHKV